MKLRILLLLIGTVLLTGCLKPPRDKFVVGAIGSSVDYLPITYAQSIDPHFAHYLDPAAYMVKNYSSEVKLARALARGSVDAAILPSPLVYKQAVAGKNVALVCPWLREGETLVMPYNRRCMADINGNKIGLLRGSTAYYLMQKLAADSSCTFKYSLHSSHNSLRGFFTNGLIDAYVDRPPFTVMNEINPTHCSLAGHWPYYPQSWLAVNTVAWQNKRSLFDQFISSQRVSMDELNGEPARLHFVSQQIINMNERIMRNCYHYLGWYMTQRQQDVVFEDSLCAFYTKQKYLPVGFDWRKYIISQE